MNHEEKVQRISSILKKKTSKDPVVLHKKAVSHQVPQYNSQKKM